MAIIGVALARNADTAQRIVINFQCDAGANVGDFVYQSSAADNKVTSITDNTLVNQTIGIIDSKPQATVASVLILGSKDGFSGLTRGDRIFISTSGTATTTKPTTGYLHNIGVALSATEILFIPNNIRTKLT